MLKNLIPYYCCASGWVRLLLHLFFILLLKAKQALVVLAVCNQWFCDLSPNKFGLGSAFIIEVVLTAFFLIIILGATDRRAPAGLLLLQLVWAYSFT